MAGGRVSEIDGRVTCVTDSSLRDGGDGKSVESTRGASMKYLQHLIILSVTITFQADAVSPIIRNVARGSTLKCVADLTGGLPLEVWKSS